MKWDELPDEMEIEEKKRKLANVASNCHRKKYLTSSTRIPICYYDQKPAIKWQPTEWWKHFIGISDN